MLALQTLIRRVVGFLYQRVWYQLKLCLLMKNVSRLRWFSKEQGGLHFAVYFGIGHATELLPDVRTLLCRGKGKTPSSKTLLESRADIGYKIRVGQMPYFYLASNSREREPHVDGILVCHVHPCLDMLHPKHCLYLVTENRMTRCVAPTRTSFVLRNVTNPPYSSGIASTSISGVDITSQFPDFFGSVLNGNKAAMRNLYFPGESLLPLLEPLNTPPNQEKE